MKTYQYTSYSTEQTIRLASKLSEVVMPGDVILLEGDLGAGKTTFSKGFASGLGVTETVNSPTFTIIKEYEGRIPLYHMDVYRVSIEEAEELGLDEYFYGKGVTLIEWASIISEIIPDHRLSIQFSRIGENERRIEMTTNIPHLQHYCEEISE